MKYNQLTDEEKRVIIGKETEQAGSGKFNDIHKKGIYICRRCNAALFLSENKFNAGCGWPSYDDAIDLSVKKETDADGIREEILCGRCGAHLGHIFKGEAFTPKNTRYCVNSISLSFIPAEKLNKAYFAGGCFWGIQDYFQRIDGIILSRVGYMGGTAQNPTYEQVCSGLTGYYETTELTYDPILVSFKELVKLFLQIHDPTQINGQGYDIGNQYLSAIFYVDEKQKRMAKDLIEILTSKGYKIATKLFKTGHFWGAEAYHQFYYSRTGEGSYCHSFVKRF